MKLEEVKTVVDSERGCGWRKPGGLYLRCDGDWQSCGKLPIPLEVCPCCSAGIKPARGWSWFAPEPFLKTKECASEAAFKAGAMSSNPCDSCPMAHPPAKAGLLWIGEKFYRTPADWTAEAQKLGVSRRIPRVPAGYKMGDRVYVAHRLAIKALCDCRGTIGDKCEKCRGEGWTHSAGIFSSFVPDRIEYVCTGKETEAELDALSGRGITPVKVVRDVDLPDIKAVSDAGKQILAEREALAIEVGQP